MQSNDVFSVAGKAVIVTGASSGLGERFARVLGANGADVLAVARRTDRLEALAAEVPGVLVNNAGYGTVVPALDEAVAEFRAVLELNLVALFELARLSARHMIDAGSGSIINIASILGLVASAPMPNASSTASKGAVVNLTRELGCQWARKGVRVNAIAPGYFPTEGTDGIEEGSTLEYLVRNCPMGRLGEEHELDGVLLFLASAASTYCTGQVLTIDGGWTAR